jgi:5-methylcytosine-specific restriction endonuclease McrA
MNLAYSLQPTDIDLTGHCPICNVAFTQHVERMTFFEMSTQPTIDRVNNSAGYTPNNVAIICADCNRLKGTMDAAAARSAAARLLLIAAFIDTHQNRQGPSNDTGH